MRRHVLTTLLLMSGLSAAAMTLSAQPVGLNLLKEEAVILAGALQEGLDLGEGSGFLGIISGRVDSLYLHGQGLVLEIRTPLASQRNRLSLSALASSLRDVAIRDNPFARIAQRQETATQAQIAGQAAEETSRVTLPANSGTTRAGDFQAAIDSAITEAARTVRILRDMGSMDPNSLVATEQALVSLRQEAEQALRDLRTWEAGQEVEQSATDRTRDGQEVLQQLQDTLAAISARARQQAAELDTRFEIARTQQRARWQEDVAALESNLFILLCQFGATLTTLPVGESVSVVLTGLGYSSEEAMAGDRVHVLSRADLVACQNGQFGAERLQQRAVSYDY